MFVRYGLAAVIVVAGLAWLASPYLAVAGMLARMESHRIAYDDLDAVALRGDLADAIAALARAEDERRRRAADRLAVLGGVVAGLHAATSVPVLLVEPMAPDEAAAVKRTQLALRPRPLPAMADPRPWAEAQARRLATPAGMAALTQAAMARSPSDWPAGYYGRLAFVEPRLDWQDRDTVALALAPSGIAPFWQGRLTVLVFRRDGLFGWRLAGVRLPPADAHARAVLDGAADTHR